MGKADYVEESQGMGANRTLQHDDATDDFGCSPRSSGKDIKAETDQRFEAKKVYPRSHQ